MRLQVAEWREMTDALEVTFQTFREAGIDPASSDEVVWHFCQEHGHYLQHLRFQPCSTRLFAFELLHLAMLFVA
jgi:hypothetical protein